MNMPATYRVLTRLAQWVTSMAILMGVWQLLAVSTTSLFVTGPVSTFEQVGTWLHDGVAWSLVRLTLGEAFSGFVIGSILGVAMALVVGLAPGIAGKVFEPGIVGLYAAPKFVLVPILFVWAGNGVIPRVILVISAVAPVIATYTLTGIRTVDTERVRMMRGLGASRRQIALKLLVPHTMSYIATGEVYVLPHATFVAVGAEILFGSSGGLGGTIFSDAQLFNAKGVFAALVLATVISAILSWIVGGVGARLKARSGG
jgi:NitT/TauT family transport system permease protein